MMNDRTKTVKHKANIKQMASLRYWRFGQEKQSPRRKE
jgi:hypothetical protein